MAPPRLLHHLDAMPVVAALVLHLVSVEVLAGMVLFAVGWLLPVCPRAIQTVAFPARIIIAICLPVALLSLVGWLWLAASQIAQAPFPAPPAMVAVLVKETRFGHLFLLRMAMLVATAISILVEWRRLRRPGMVSLVFSQLLLVSLSWASHGAAGIGGASYGLLTAHILHLLATAAWVGSLPMVVALASRKTESSVAALRSYGRFGMVAVTGIVATGVTMLTLMAHHGLSLSQPFTRVLCIKLVLVATTGGLGLFNRLRLIPRLSDAPADAFRALRTSASVETLFAFAVVCAAAVLSQTPPP